MPRKKKRYKDKTSAGKSIHVPFKPGEDGSDRHKRRLHEALLQESRMRVFCEQQDMGLSICNGGHQWSFVYMDSYRMFTADWWPSSAKLILQKKWDNGVHTHDADQAIGVISRAFEEWKAKPALLPPIPREVKEKMEQDAEA